MLDIKRCIEEFKPDGVLIDSENQFGFIANGLVWDSFPLSFLEKSSMFESLYYPLFLQRVIEGINRSQTYSNSSFIQNNYAIEAYREDLSWETFNFEYYDSIDEAKEQAIQYILDQL